MNAHALPATRDVPESRESVRPRDGDHAAGETCDYCGADSLAWRKCKLICGNCSQINKSCADL